MHKQTDRRNDALGLNSFYVFVWHLKILFSSQTYHDFIQAENER
jgi:hypothetical protein